ncbi:MAG TPA: 16S rRNA (guanine(966)-N(2))-methyltransferase RsmD [Candidatus Edwardsbacteria bacterium]|nr:16S rRNA (guanine(966)-N(2))-methyltransferase RsmD [Candidatus Edwardsbacteria bacterium]
MSFRVIAGEFRGRNLATPPGTDVRPTSGLVRGVIFNVLQDFVPERTVLDCYAGSGALAIEALSRGAARATLVEMNPASLEAIAQNLSLLKLRDRAHAVRLDALDFLAGCDQQYDLIMADPPYGLKEGPEVLQHVAQRALLVTGGILVIQQSSNDPVPDGSGALRLWKHKQHGRTAVCFYRQ